MIEVVSPHQADSDRDGVTGSRQVKIATEAALARIQSASSWSWNSVPRQSNSTAEMGEREKPREGYR